MLPDGFELSGSERNKIEHAITDMKNATGPGDAVSPAESPAASPTGGYYGKGKKGKGKKGKKGKGGKGKGGKKGHFVATKAPIVQPTASTTASPMASPAPVESTAMPAMSLFDGFKADARAYNSDTYNSPSTPSSEWSPTSPAWSPASSPVVSQSKSRSYSHDSLDTTNQVLSPVYEHLSGVRKSRKSKGESRAAHKLYKTGKKGKKRA